MWLRFDVLSIGRYDDEANNRSFSSPMVLFVVLNVIAPPFSLLQIYGVLPSATAFIALYSKMANAMILHSSTSMMEN